MLIKELAVGSAPCTDEHIELLKDSGIKGILSLCNQKEVILPDLLKKNFKYHYFPLPDHSYGRNPNLIEVLESLEIICKLKKFGPVYVHCLAGVERSPLICMAWLVKYKGFSPIESLEYLMQVNEGTNPLPGQFKLLNKLLLSKN